MNATSDYDEFKLLVTSILNNWFGLQAAISHGMGGTPAQTSSKLSQLTETITNTCFSSETDKEDLAITLEDLIDEFFHTEFEDGSVDEIAEILWNYRRDWLAGNKESIRAYIAAKQKNSERVLQRQNVQQDKMDIEEEEPVPENTPESSGPSQPVEDPDGWIISQRRRKR